MTVSTVVDHNDYTGNGVTTSFPYTFRIFKKTDLTVSVVDLDENITVLVLDTDYTVTNAGGYNGGSVVLTTPLTNGWQISIARELEPTQETDLRNQGKFFAEVHEDAFDKLTMLIQQVGSMFRLALRKPSSIANWYDALNNYIRNVRDPRDPQDAATKNYVDTLSGNNLNRTLRVPESIPQLPNASIRANKIIAFDAAGNPFVTLPPSGSATDVLTELAKPTGAELIGASFGGTVQDELDENSKISDVLQLTNSLSARRYGSYRGIKRTLSNIAAWSASDVANDKISPTDTVYYRLPQILKLPSGVLAIFTNELHGNSADIGTTADQQCNLVCKTSSDNGTTWSAKIVIADFGPTFQNGEMCVIYNHVSDRIYLFFTSCKGQTGWGYSQPGTIDPDQSVQIYMTHCDGESFAWNTPVNITAMLKENDESFAWTSPCRGVVFPSGEMGVVTSSIKAGSNDVTTFLCRFNGYELTSKKVMLTHPDTGGEVGIHLLQNGKLLALSRGLKTSDNKGVQLLFCSDESYDSWTKLSSVVTSDVKGDLVCLNDGLSGSPLWALTVANGANDDGLGRFKYRVWFSRDLVTWTKSPVSSINDVVVGYISTYSAGDKDGFISATEVSQYQGIWFTQVSQNYIRSRTYSINSIGLMEVNNSDVVNMLSSGAVKNYQHYINKSNNTLCINYNGNEKVIRQFGVNSNTTFVISTNSGTVNVDGIDIISVSSGQYSLDGLTGGVIGQTVSIMSLSTTSWVKLNRQSSSVASTERFYFAATGSNTAIQIAYNLIALVRVTKTVNGWVTDAVANVAT
ncbi:hypothetical protein ACS6GB_06060 [Enterobacter hormaechei subsp. xiangfangensis]|uniref:hypothetical protein n=1 Tax=Enterobacter hormaechei TaxID=158836 RepID=UPI003F44066C